MKLLDIVCGSGAQGHKLQGQLLQFCTRGHGWAITAALNELADPGKHKKITQGE